MQASLYAQELGKHLERYFDLFQETSPWLKTVVNQSHRSRSGIINTSTKRRCTQTCLRYLSTCDWISIIEGSHSSIRLQSLVKFVQIIRTKRIAAGRCLCEWSNLLQWRELSTSLNGACQRAKSERSVSRTTYAYAVHERLTSKPKNLPHTTALEVLVLVFSTFPTRPFDSLRLRILHGDGTTRSHQSSESAFTFGTEPPTEAASLTG